MDYHILGPCEWRGDTTLDQFVLSSCTFVVHVESQIGPWRLLKSAAASEPGTPFAPVSKFHEAEPTP